MDGGSHAGAGATLLEEQAGQGDADAPPDDLGTASGPPLAAPRVRLIDRTRTRLFAIVVLLLGATVLIAVVAIPQVLRLRLDRRIDAELDQEIEEVQGFLASAVDPSTGAPFTSLGRAYDQYLERNVPSIEEGFIAYVDGELVRQRLRSFPGNDVPTGVAADFAALTTGDAEAGVVIKGEFDTPRGEASYAALPAVRNGSTGVFVVAILPEAGRREIRELQTFGAGIMFAVVLVAGTAAWVTTGRALQPVRELTETARSISESDRTRRARVADSGEGSELAATFNAMLDRLDAAHASQQDFVHAAGHELRTPLTVAIGHLELVGDRAEEAHDVLPLVLDELARMGRILDDLQALAMSEQPDFVVPAPVDADVLAVELLVKSGPLAPRAWTLGPTTTTTFMADRDRLTEAALNLIDNAVKSTDADDTITVGVYRRGDEIVLEVGDSGAGIPPEEVERVLERFVRGTRARSAYRGSGLGLSIVRSIAGAHGGRVTIESEPGEGTTVRVIIPFVPAAGAGGDS